MKETNLTVVNADMGEVSLEASTVNKFISSLSKSIQALCHGCMDFNNSIEMIGYININIDSGNVVDCVLNEKVRKSAANSMTCVSNSFNAKKEKPKQTKDSSCSPIRHSEYASQMVSNKRQFNDGEGFTHTHRGSARKRHRHHPKSVMPSTSEYYSTSHSQSSFHEHSAYNSSEFLYPERGVKTEMPENVSSDLDPSVATTSQDFSIKKETDSLSAFEAPTEGQDMKLAESGDFGEQNRGEESSQVNPEYQSQETSESGIDTDVGHGESSHLGQQDDQDTQALHDHDQQPYHDNQMESNEDAQFEVIEIGDDDEDVQGLFDQTGTQSMISMRHQQMPSTRSHSLYPWTGSQGSVFSSEYLASRREKKRFLSRSYRMNRTNEQIERERWLARIRQRRRRARLRGRIYNQPEQEEHRSFILHQP